MEKRESEPNLSYTTGIFQGNLMKCNTACILQVFSGARYLLRCEGPLYKNKIDIRLKWLTRSVQKGEVVDFHERIENHNPIFWKTGYFVNACIFNDIYYNCECVSWVYTCTKRNCGFSMMTSERCSADGRVPSWPRLSKCLMNVEVLISYLSISF